MLYITVVTILLFLPGFCMARILGINRYLFLISFSLSYSFFVISLKYSQLSGLDVTEFRYLYFVIVVTLSIGAVWLSVKRSGQGIKAYLCTSVFYMKQHGQVLSGGVAIFILLIVYFSLVGPYVEIPSDIFQHLEYIQTMSRNIEISATTQTSLSQYYLHVNGKYWHYLYSFINSWSGLDVRESIPAASFFNNLVFLLSSYCFSLIIFRKQAGETRSLVYISLITCLFLFLHLGVNVFSFFRYYAMAPVMLNMTLYFTVVAIALNYFESNKWRARELVIASVILYASALIHQQEALFAVIMIMMLSLYYFLRLNIPLMWGVVSKKTDAVTEIKYLSKVNIVFIAVVSVFFSVWIYSYIYKDINSVSLPKLFDLGSYSAHLSSLYILNPAYQFYYVITWWGVAVYVLFILNWRKFKDNAFIVAGMLSPIFTVFNPVFVDLYLRYGQSISLWRLSFIIPLSFAAGYLLIRTLTDVKRYGLRHQISALFIVPVLVVPLFPLPLDMASNHYTRLSTILKQEKGVTPEHWGDLLDYLDTLESRQRIITDPVTGYVISALTRHSSPRYKFHRIRGYVEFNFDDYQNHPLDRYDRFLLIINKRDGATSQTGRLARHWPEEILKVSKYYSDALEPYVKSHKKRFIKLWENDGITVYKIRRP